MSKVEGLDVKPTDGNISKGNLTGYQRDIFRLVKDKGENSVRDLDVLLTKNPTRISNLVDDDENNVFHVSRNAEMTNYLWHYILDIEFPQRQRTKGRAVLKHMLRQTNVHKRTPLIEMIHKRAANSIQVLYGVGLNLKQWTEDGQTPLGIAVKTGSAEVVETLLVCGANPTQRSGGFLPVEIAEHLTAGEEKGKILRFLTEYEDKASDDDTRAGFVRGLPPTIFSDEKEDMLERILFDKNSIKDMTPEDLTLEIVKHGDDRRAFMALRHIVEGNKLRGEDIAKFKDKNGESILLSSPTPEMTNALFGITDFLWNKDTAIVQEKLIKEVKSGDVDQIMILWGNGADVNIKTKDGKTLLHVAIEQGNIDVIRALLVCGADVNLQSNGKTPTQIAQESSHTNRAEIQNLLQGFQKPQTFLLSQIGKKEENKKHLDGGGIRGLILITMLKHIQDRCGRPIRELFDFIGGTSTGGIIALVLGMQESSLETIKKMTGAEDRLEILERLYFKMVKQVFDGEFIERCDAITKLLKDACNDDLMKDIGKTNTGEENMKVIVTALDVVNFPPSPTVIRSYDPNEGHKVWEAARCTSAAPTYFSHYNYKIDGGLFANNPTLDVLSELAKLNILAKNQQRCEVSLGCGQEKKKPFDYEDIQVSFADIQGSWWNPFTWFIRINALWTNRSAIMKASKVMMYQSTASSGSPVDRSSAWCKSMGWPFYRFEPEFEEVVDLDERDIKKLENIVWETRKYLNANQEMIDSLVKDMGWM